jgi:hypothetical protein
MTKCALLAPALNAAAALRSGKNEEPSPAAILARRGFADLGGDCVTAEVARLVRSSQ